MLDGRWTDVRGTPIQHSTLLKAKHYCSKKSKCFGITVGTNSTNVCSVNFPIRAHDRSQGSSYIYKKEHVFGNIVYHE